MKKLVLAALILALLASAFLGGTASAEEATTLDLRVTLTKIGSVDANLLKRASFAENGIKMRTDDNKYQLLNYQGVNALGESYDYVEQFANGAWLVYQADKGINCCGLVKADGTVLIPVSAAIIQAVRGSDGAYRFVEVIYATEEVADEKDAFLFATNRLVALSPEEGDKLYAGYALFFDMENSRFVGDLKRADKTETSYDVRAFGDKLFFSKRQALFDANGVAVAELSRYAYIDNGMLIDRGDDGSYSVYDSDMKKIASFQEMPDRLCFGGQLLAYRDYDADRTIIRNRDGVQVSDLPFKYLSGEYGSFLYGYDSEDHYMVIDRTGKTLIDDQAGVTYVSEEPLGLLGLDFADKTEGLLFPDGTIIKGEERRDLLVGVPGKTDGTVAVLVLKDKDFTLQLDSDISCDSALYSNNLAPVFCAGMKNGVATLFNVVDGKALLQSDYPYAYDAFHYADGYIYARQGETFEIYKVDVQF